MKVKEIIITIILTVILNFSILQISNAQNYQAVLKTDSTSWTMATQQLFGIELGLCYTKTIMDSLFSNVYYTGDYPSPDLIGKLREDVTTGKLWFTSSYSDTEYLIMDMGLKIGDIFEFREGFSSQVDSIYYLEGRKVIQFEYFSTRWDEPIRFIEGAGPNNIFSTENDIDWFYMSCKFDQEELAYVNSNIHFIGCMPDPTGLSENNNLQNEMSIYPNPVTNTSYIELSEQLSGYKTIEIYNLLGKLCHSVSLTEGVSRIELKNTGFKTGVYIVTLKGLNQMPLTNKILIINN